MAAPRSGIFSQYPGGCEWIRPNDLNNVFKTDFDLENLGGRENVKLSLKADNLLNVPRETEHDSCTFMLTADHRSVCKCGNIRSTLNLIFTLKVVDAHKSCQSYKSERVSRQFLSNLLVARTRRIGKKVLKPSKKKVSDTSCGNS